MSLFDQLAKKGLSGLKNKLEQAAGSVLNETFDKYAGNGQRDGRSAQSEAKPFAPAQTARPSADLNAFFTSLLSEEFGSYETEKGLSAFELGFGSVTPVKPYDFALLQNGACKAVIMLTPHNRDNNAAFKNARASAGRAGVPFINFYTHFPNERSYVVNRIQSFLN